jgi:hypothetical protein
MTDGDWTGRKCPSCSGYGLKAGDDGEERRCDACGGTGDEWMSWQPIATAPERVVVRTKIDDEHGPRNDQKLKRIGGLWYVPDGSMYVYYRPTHWMASEGKDQ